jgi:hypothetical protein
MNWSTVLKYLVKAAIWAASNPDDVKAMVDVVKKVKEDKKP